jgi:hypothetical protein
MQQKALNESRYMEKSSGSKQQTQAANASSKCKQQKQAAKASSKSKQIRGEEYLCGLESYAGGHLITPLCSESPLSLS